MLRAGREEGGKSCREKEIELESRRNPKKRKKERRQIKMLKHLYPRNKVCVLGKGQKKLVRFKMELIFLTQTLAFSSEKLDFFKREEGKG